MVAGQEHARVCHLARLAHPADRVPGAPFPDRLAGIERRRRVRRGAGAVVSLAPGSTTVARFRSLASSTAKTRVNATIAPLMAVQATALRWQATACPGEML
jgi:hypothetical protein